MKNSLWLVIGIIAYVGAIFICFFNPNGSFEGALFSGLVITSIIMLSIMIGYLMIYILEKKDIYNMFAAILMPCMAIFALWLIISLTLPSTMLGYGFALEMLFPFLLIASGFGGVLAHKKRMKQHG